MSLQVSRILHAGYLLQHANTRIAFDPIFENPFSVNCYAFPSVAFDLESIKRLKLDAVFISHYHDDHCSLQSLDLLDRETPLFMFCVFEEMFSLLRELGFKKVHSLKLNGSIQVGNFKITPRRALDQDVDSLFQIQVAGLNVLNVVDSWIDPETLDVLLQEPPWDLILWPFQTMQELEVLSPLRAQAPLQTLPPEWIEQLKILNPRIVVPSSCQFLFEDWSWYNQVFFPISYQNFKKTLKDILPQTQVVQLDPGSSMQIDRGSVCKAPSLDWIKPVGPQNLDYTYQPLHRAPRTSEIAKKLPAPSTSETHWVDHYCKTELLKKYCELGEPNDFYFQKEIFWNLRVYDHSDEILNYYYSLQQNKITWLDHKPKNISWLTEVPLIKIYNALKKGESLTSMYVRINDEVFEPKIEKELKDVDLLEDPLIRCLFNGSFAAYQKYQLKKIRQHT